MALANELKRFVNDEGRQVHIVNGHEVSSDEFDAAYERVFGLRDRELQPA
jgi:hypothetical protein